MKIINNHNKIIIFWWDKQKVFCIQHDYFYLMWVASKLLTWWGKIYLTTCLKLFYARHSNSKVQAHYSIENHSVATIHTLSIAMIKEEAVINETKRIIQVIFFNLSFEWVAQETVGTMILNEWYMYEYTMVDNTHENKSCNLCQH